MPVEVSADVSSSSGEAWRKDLNRFRKLNVMRPKFEEAIEGNKELDTKKSRAAAIIAMGSDASTRDLEELADIFEALYYKEPLAKYLCDIHPSTSTSNLSKS